MRKEIRQPLSVNGFNICKDCEFRLVGCPVTYSGSGPLLFNHGMVMNGKDHSSRVDMIDKMKCAEQGKSSSAPEFCTELKEYCTSSFLEAFRTQRIPMITGIAK